MKNEILKNAWSVLCVTYGAWGADFKQEIYGGLAHLGRANALQALGGRFEPDILHQENWGQQRAAVFPCKENV